MDDGSYNAESDIDLLESKAVKNPHKLWDTHNTETVVCVS